MSTCHSRKMIAAEGVEVPKSNMRSWDLQIQADKIAVANLPDNPEVDKQDKKAVAVDVIILNNSNIRKKEEKKLEKYNGLKEKLERMWGMKGISGTSGDRSTKGFNTQAPRNNPGITQE